MKNFLEVIKTATPGPYKLKMPHSKSSMAVLSCDSWENFAKVVVKSTANENDFALEHEFPVLNKEGIANAILISKSYLLPEIYSLLGELAAFEETPYFSNKAKAIKEKLDLL